MHGVVGQSRSQLRNPENGHWREFRTKEQSEEHAHSLGLLHVGSCALCL